MFIFLAGFATGLVTFYVLFKIAMYSLQKEMEIARELESEEYENLRM
jgi:hypothetical protein